MPPTRWPTGPAHGAGSTQQTRLSRLGSFTHLACRGDGPLTEQWLTSPAGSRWNVIGTGSRTSGLRPPAPFKRGESRTGSGGSCESVGGHPESSLRPAWPSRTPRVRRTSSMRHQRVSADWNRIAPTKAVNHSQ